MKLIQTPSCRHRRAIAFCFTAVLSVISLPGCQLFTPVDKDTSSPMGWLPESSTIRYQDVGSRFQSQRESLRPPISPQAQDVDLQQEKKNVDPAHLVLDVRIKGNRSIPTHHLTRHIRTRPGRFFDPDLLQQDVKDLWKLKEVRRVNGPFLEKTKQGVVVTLEIVESNLIGDIKYIGNRALTDRQLRKKSELKKGEPFDPHQVRMAKQRIEDFYREKGFTRTQVEVVEGDEVGDNNVVFLVHEDKKQRIWKTEFVGNQIVSDARLRTFIKSKPGILWTFGGNLVRDQIDQDQTRITAYYRSLGYFNARIGRELIENESGWASIRFVVDEGPRYKVRSVSFVGNQRYLGEDLATLVKLKPDANGEMPAFNAAKMAVDVNTLRDMYGSQGHVFADVQAEPRFLEEPGMLDLVYKISEGQAYRVGKINVHVEGDYGVTKHQVVLNRLGLRPGDLIDVREVRASERRLGSAQIFSTGQQGGQAPRIVVRPPELKKLERMAQEQGTRSGSSFR